MKKNIIIAGIAISLYICSLFENVVHAAEAQNEKTTIFVTEMIPGGECECVKKSTKDEEGRNITGLERAERAADGKSCAAKIPPQERLYQCKVEKGLKGFQGVIRVWIKWILNFATILGVLAIAALGVVWTTSGSENPEQKKFLKEWLIGLIIGLGIVFFFQFILRFLAPWIYN